MRVRRLDALRGVAALVVVVHHCLLAIPSLARPYFGDGHRDWGSPSTWFTWTPLHVLWDGPQAVAIFFVLSGLVLTLSVGDGVRWAGYYPRRLVRLYVPVAAAVLLGLALLHSSTRTFTGADGPWLQTHPSTLASKKVAEDLALVHSPGNVNTALWSLQWEVIFSLLLPAYVLAARRLGRQRGLVGAGVLAATAVVVVGAERHDAWVTYLPMFALGCLLATSDLARRLPRSPLVPVAALPALSARWYLAPSGNVAAAMGTGIGLLASMALVALVLDSRRSTAWLDHRVLGWLGSRSFSLYLVHEPIIVTADSLCHGGARPWGVAVAVLVSLAVAELFWRVVEGPTITLSRRIGRLVAGQAARPRPPVSAGAALP